MKLLSKRKAIEAHVLALRDKGYLCVPLHKHRRHLDLSKMGYQPVHLANRKKTLKELAFAAITFHLSQFPPDDETIQRWFGSGCNIGILGGYRNLIILDFDCEVSFQDWRRRVGDIVRHTPVAKTVRGYHVYFRHDSPVPTSSLYVGFQRIGHVKALGGYVVAPPSQYADGFRYRWLDGQSPFDREPQAIASIESLGLSPVSPLKYYYDRLLKRGTFDDR